MFNKEKALVGVFSVISDCKTSHNLRESSFEALFCTLHLLVTTGKHLQFITIYNMEPFLRFFQ